MAQPPRVRLATKFLLLVFAVILLATASSGLALYTSWQLESLLQATVQQNLASVRAAEELEIALLEQRGLVASYILDDRDPKWLDRLRQVEPQFNTWLSKARQTVHSSPEHAILQSLESVYSDYDKQRQSVLDLCQTGNVSQATQVLLDDVQQCYLDAFTKCEAFLRANEHSVDEAIGQARQRVQRLTVIMSALAAVTVISSGGLLWLFFGGVLLPLRRMVDEMRSFSGEDNLIRDITGPQDELAAIREYLRTLMLDVTGARSTLQQRQSQLKQAEKLAAVGKLAASVAHEIRNPLTAMKMWLFSLRRSHGGDADGDRKFDLIADELQRLESVVQHFLEFSRPPQLKTTPCSLADLLDKTLELLQPRLMEKNVRILISTMSELPMVMVDSDQFKQVLINVLVNAGDAIVEGGSVKISATQADMSGRWAVVLHIRDSGPGMSPQVQDRIFQPFYTTKEQGTGLGLCIAAQIMAAHDGRLALESTSPQGSCFEIWIPVA